jgi:hypothetical protein
MPPSIIRTRSQEKIAMEQEAAAKLAVEEQQWREEKAIQENLPREVLNIGCRLEEQRLDTRKALDNIHAEIAKLAQLVMATATATTTAPPLTTPSTTPPPAPGNPASVSAQSHQFSTPPPLPSSVLSRILELATPQFSTPPPSTMPPPSLPQYGMPLHFGHLSPHQLPHPIFPNNTSTITTPVYTVTNPITSSIPPNSAEMFHLSQITNPNTQPQYYTQPSSTPLPYTSYIPTHSPYYTYQIVPQT